MQHPPRLLAIDVDGTLIQPDQIVAPAVIDALDTLSQKGVCIALATGRNLTETLPAWKQLRLNGSSGPIITNGGAIASDAATGRTLYQKPLQPEAAEALGQALRANGKTAVANVDRWRWGIDMLVLPGEDYAETRRRWFDRMPDLRIREVDRLDSNDLQSPDVLRINAVLSKEEGTALTDALTRQFEGQLTIHTILAPNYGVYFMEAFDPGASKWSAVHYVAQGLRVGPGGVVAIGDDINDLPMIQHAGLGVAMPGVPEEVRAAADRVAEPDLATFLRSLL